MLASKTRSSKIKKARAQLRELQNNTASMTCPNTLSRILNNQYELAQRAYSEWVAASREVRNLEVRVNVEERLHDQLLDAYDRRASARIQYFQRLCDFNKAVASVHFVKGSLLEYNGIELAEGPWPKKAYWDALETSPRTRLQLLLQLRLDPAGCDQPRTRPGRAGNAVWPRRGDARSGPGG